MDSIEQIVDVTEYDSLLNALADALEMKGWTVYDEDARKSGFLDIERRTNLTDHPLTLTIDMTKKDMDSSRDWMEEVCALVHNWDPVEEALIVQHVPEAPRIDRIIDDFKSTYENEIRPLEGICQTVTDAWAEMTQSDRVRVESLDQMCNVAFDTAEELADAHADMQPGDSEAR